MYSLPVLHGALGAVRGFFPTLHCADERRVMLPSAGCSTVTQ